MATRRSSSSSKSSSNAKRALALHAKLRGKIEITSKTGLRTLADLSLVYTPGVGAVSSAIAEHPELAEKYTWVRNSVAIVSDGSAVLGLGNIGPKAALPVMEGKAVIFKRFTDIDAVPIVLSTQDPDEVVAAVKAIAPTFGAIQLEDISAPRCFDIERRLAEALDMPVMHDDQHGTAIVALAGLTNALKVVKKSIESVRIVCSGAGAAGVAIAKLLRVAGAKNVILCDTKGAIYAGRPDLNPSKIELAAFTNPGKEQGALVDVIRNADVFIGISKPGVLTPDMIRTMADRPIVFALANPVPEILPNEALAAGAAVAASGRSDFPNQINNALCYPGLFRGMLDARVHHVDDEIKLRAVKAIAGFVKKPTADRIVPSIFDRGLHEAVAKSVGRARKS